MTSGDEKPREFMALPGRPGLRAERMAAYVAVLRELIDLVGFEPPKPEWRWESHHQMRQAVGIAVKRRAREDGPVPEEWFEPLVRAAVHEPDPSFNRHLVEPAMIAFGRRRVQEALIALIEANVTPEGAADATGAANAWYWSQVPLSYPAGSKSPTPESHAEWESVGDLRRRFLDSALRRFVADDDIRLRRSILSLIPLGPAYFPADLHHLVNRAVEIARTSDDEYLRHRVEIQVD